MVRRIWYEWQRILGNAHPSHRVISNRSSWWLYSILICCHAQVPEEHESLIYSFEDEQWEYEVYDTGKCFGTMIRDAIGQKSSRGTRIIGQLRWAFCICCFHALERNTVWSVRITVISLPSRDTCLYNQSTASIFLHPPPNRRYQSIEHMCPNSSRTHSDCSE